MLAASGHDGQPALPVAEETEYLPPDERRLYPLLESSADPVCRRDVAELERISEEIEVLEERVEGLRGQYHIVDKLGEGTFSIVYKALDLHHGEYENDEWIEAYARSMAPGALPPSLTQEMDLDQASDSQARGSARYLRASQYFRQTGKPVYVALKRIFVTSSPARIYNELEILSLLRGGPCVSHLITAWRSQDQVLAVMPYVRHVDFREYYRIIPVGDLRYYFHSLLSALRWCHAHNVIHRDVKPGNFLYNPVTGLGTLCDFGLAEIFDPSRWQGHCHHGLPTEDYPHGQTRINDHMYSTHFCPGGMLHPSSRPAGAGQMVGSMPAQTCQHLHANIAIAWGGATKPGYAQHDARPSLRANRAGTRGFRAPEVLLRCPDQTVAIDIWSVGVIMLAFLTKRFPLFNAMDDVTALLELGTIFGKRRMEQVALLHNRTFICSVPTVDESLMTRIPDWIHLLNPYLMDTTGMPCPDEAIRLVNGAIEFAKSCMQLDCTRRWTAEHLLSSHPFFEGAIDRL